MIQNSNSNPNAFDFHASISSTQSPILSSDLKAEKLDSLSRIFLTNAFRYFDMPVVSDESGTLTYGQLLSRVLALALVLRPRLTPSKAVGVLLPPSILAVTSNIALTLLGRVVVNIDLEAGDNLISQYLSSSGVEQVLSGRSLVDQLELELKCQLLDLRQLGSFEDATVRQQVNRLLASSLNSFEYEFAGLSTSINEVAAVFYRSLSSGEVVSRQLSHSEVIAEVQALMPVLNDDSLEEVLLGAIPFSEVQGYTDALWAFLFHGIKAVFVSEPSSASALESACEKYKVTILVSGENPQSDR